MKQWRLHFPVQAMSRLLAVSRSGFYAWLKHKPSRRQQEDERLKLAIQAAHRRTRETMAAGAYSLNWPQKAFRRGETGLVACVGHWGCAAGRNGNSRRRPIRTTVLRWRITCWNRPLRLQPPTRCG